MTSGSDKSMARSVVRRRVFYIPGFDPFPARRYRELYRKEGAAQAALSDYALGVAGCKDGWTVDARFGDDRVETHVTLLGWSDIVRRSMSGGILATYGQLLRTAWIYLASGALFRLMRLRKGPMLAALYPVAALLLQLLLGCLAVWLVGAMLVWLTGSGWAWLPAAPLLPLVLHLFRRSDGRFMAWYLMHDFAFSAQGRGRVPAALEPRLAAFSDAVAKALRSDVDEVLVVGHSSGAHHALGVLASLIRQGRVQADGPALSLLTLGQVVPMVSFLPEAGQLRDDLSLLSETPALSAWVDVSAPGDGCSFALCDPVAVSGVAGPGKRHPLVLSAAFRNTLTAETLARLRRRWFRLHFQYLCAFDNLAGRADDYDYFAITAGPKTLRERFSHRAPSKSRIEIALSGYHLSDQDRAA
ncbi:MAG: hypothetical protein ACRCSU_11410 [Paracoccaceae bacterium]